MGSQRLAQAVAKLPVTVSDIGLRNRQQGDRYLTGVSFKLRVNLTGNGDAGRGFGANTTAVVWGKKNTERWSYYNCSIERLELEQVSIGPMKMAGYVEFFRDDVEYGSGFTGGIDLDLKIASGNIGLDVQAIFGKQLTSSGDLDYRYWAVDAMANFPKLPLMPALLYMNGFGGGASYRMAQVKNPPASTKYITKTGTGFTPDKSIGLGLRAMVGLQGESTGAYNGEVAFEMVFDADGSVNNVMFSGFVEIASVGKVSGIDASMVSDMASKLEGKTGDQLSQVALAEEESDRNVQAALKRRDSNAAIMAQWLMQMDFTQNTFTADVDVFFNASNVITGVNPYDNAGSLNVLFSPDEWYIHVGRPASPMGLKFSLLGSVAAKAYLVMGSTIPAPKPPDDYQGPWAFDGDLNRGSVKGFGFGARLEAKISKGGAFYFEVTAGIGFDILLRDVGGLVCSETGKPFGVKNWYATGTAYAYLNIVIGLKACANLPYLKCWKAWKRKCWGTKRVCVDTRINPNISVAVTVNAPNPTNLAYHTSFLGKDVTFRIGKRCTF